MPLCQPDALRICPHGQVGQELLLHQKLPVFKEIGLMLHKAKPAPHVFSPKQPPELWPDELLLQSGQRRLNSNPSVPSLTPGITAGSQDLLPWAPFQVMLP